MHKRTKTICWLITNKCNRRCSFCISKSSPLFDIESLENQIDILKRLKTLGANKISISGGEPFVVKHLKDIVEYLIQIKVDFQITTNSDFFIKKGIPNWILDYKVPIILSLYGGEKEHDFEMGKGHFQNVLKVAREFSKEQISVNIIETKQSIEFIKDNLDFLVYEFSRVLLIRKMNTAELINDNNYEELKRLFNNSILRLDFQFLFHNYYDNDVFPVINDKGEITFTSNNKIEFLGSIFTSKILFEGNEYCTSDFLEMLWLKQYTNQKMKTKVYGWKN